MLEDILLDWGKFLLAGLGMATGYGVLTNKVSNLERDLKEHKTSEHARLLRVETKVDEIDKILEGVKVSVENIDRNVDKLDGKLDRLIERNI